MPISSFRCRTTQRTSDGKVVDRPEDEHIIVEDAHDPIIDMETWEKVQARIENREYASRVKMEFDPCELAGLCVCKVCNRRMVRQYSTQHYKKKDGTTNIYHKEFLWCTTAGCTFVKYRNIERDLLTTLEHLQNLSDTDLTAAMKELVKESESAADYSNEDLQRNIELKKEDLLRRRKFIYKKHEDGIYTDEDLIERRNEIDKELAQLEKTQITPVDKTQPLSPSRTREKITSILERYEKTTHKSARNEILKSVFDKVIVEVIERGRGRKEAVHAIYPYLKADIVTH